MRAIDDEILALLATAVPPIDVDGDGDLEDRVHDGYVPVADTDSNVITAALPFHEVTREIASAMWIPMRSCRTMIGRMSAAAACSIR